MNTFQGVFFGVFFWAAVRGHATREANGRKGGMANRCRPLRVERHDCLWFVSTRTIEERFWLMPLLCSNDKRTLNRDARRKIDRYERRMDRRIARLVDRVNASKGPYQAKLDVETAKVLLRDYVGAALSRAQELYEVRIHAIIVMSNHLHLVVSTPNKNLRMFMGYVKARIADTTNFLHGRRGPLWYRRYDAEPVLDDEAATGRVVYGVGNPPQDDLVEAVDEWPGLCAAYGLRGVTSLEFKYFDRTAWHRARRPDDISRFIKTVRLELSPLPHMEGLSVKEVQAEIGELVRNREERERRRRSADEKSVLGLDGLAQMDFEGRPRHPKRSRRPCCHAACASKRMEHMRDTKALHEVYSACSVRFLRGELAVVFPAGTYPPPLLAAA